MSGGTGTRLSFTIEIDATRDLAVDADRVEALITIQATSGGIPAPAARVAEILIMDRTYLRLRLNDRFRIAAVTQTKPAEADLTGQQRPAGATAVDVPLGSWEGQAARRYQVSLRFDPDTIPAGEKLRAARVELLAELPDGTREPCAHAPLTVFRQATPGFATIMPGSLTRAESERELGLAMRACADAWLHQRSTDAEVELNLALRLARELGDVRLAVLKSVSVMDPGGRARLHPGVTVGEMQRLGLDSTKTSQPASGARPALWADRPGAEPGADRPEREASRPAARGCEVCGEPNREDAAYCVECGESLRGGEES